MKQRNCKFGIFYYDKNEPRLFISENLNLTRAFAINGNIVNFAHWYKLVAIIGIAVVIGIVAVMLLR